MSQVESTVHVREDADPNRPMCRGRRNLWIALLACLRPVDKPDLDLGALRYRGPNMAERQDDISGMGSVPRGPSFLPWTPAEPPLRALPNPDRTGPYLGPPTVPLADGHLGPGHRAGRGGGCRSQPGRLLGRHPHRRPARPEARPSVTSPPDRIDFVSNDGTGQLIMRTRSWISGGPGAADHRQLPAGRGGAGVHLR